MSQSFPLPLSPFEQYMLADDTPCWPMSFLLQFRFAGRAQREPLSAALQATLPGHPLLSAQIEKQGSQYVWVAGAQLPTLDWAEFDGPLRSSIPMKFDLQREPGARFFVRVADDATFITCHMHHAVADGIGGFRFVADWLAAYDRILTGQPADAPVAVAVDLRHRNEIDLAPPRPVTLGDMARGVVALLFEMFKFLFLLPDNLGKGQTAEHPHRPKTPTVDWTEQHSLTLTADESRAIRSAAKGLNVTVNDLMLRDAYIALAAWQAEQPGRKRGRLRLTIPTSMRDATHERLSCSNVLSYVFMTRYARQARDPATLLQGIHEETALVKYWRWGGVFLGMVSIAQKLRILRPALRMPVCFSTLVLSNLGPLTGIIGDRLPRQGHRYYAGNLTLVEVCGAPPRRNRSPLSMAVFFYDERQILCLGIDSAAISHAAAERLLSIYRQQLLDTTKRVLHEATPSPVAPQAALSASQNS